MDSSNIHAWISPRGKYGLIFPYLCKLFTAEIAIVPFLNVVIRQMFTQISRVRKPLATHLALVQPIMLLYMHHLVCLQVPTCLELLVTDIAAVELVSRVHALVGIKMTNLGKRFSTDPAAIGPVVLVNPLVQEKSRLLEIE